MPQPSNFMFDVKVHFQSFKVIGLISRSRQQKVAARVYILSSETVYVVMFSARVCSAINVVASVAVPTWRILVIPRRYVMEGTEVLFVFFFVNN